MRIGVDIDGVLNDVGRFELDYGSKFYVLQTGKHMTNPNGYGSDKIFGGTSKEDNTFWAEAIYDFVKYPARDFAGEVLDRLRSEGHEIYIITSRISDLDYCDISNEKMEKIVLKWLKKYKIHYDKLIFAVGSKLKYCKEEHVDVMIEDKPKNIIELSRAIPVICFDAMSNREVKGENILRCYSWFDIYDKIKNLKPKDCK